ncbi:MAG: hypothetical protein JW722_05075 [Demequinaceae bacterium]|nr:hypothetical protein [Demequinaceae bacterium]
MKQHLRRISAIGDSGSALVATMGVAIIGLAFSLIVVTQAISITNDAARDRVRTVEIHAAEAALDAAFRSVETETPCTTEATVGEGSYAVDVTVGIKYYDASGELLCVDGVVAGTPTKAVLTSSAIPTYNAPGAVVPQRQMQATVNLIPLSTPSMGVALFAGSGINISNSGTIAPLDPSEIATVWVENQSVNCSNSVTIEANLIITDGGLNISNTCRIAGDTWVRSNMNASNNVSPNRVGGDLVVYDGDLNASNNQIFGGSVSVGGNLNGTYTAAGAVCADNVGTPCGTLPLYTGGGMPEVYYDPSDWPASFIEKDIDDWAQDVIDGAGLTGSKVSSYLGSPCTLSGSVIKNPIVLDAEDSLYDLRTCTFNTNNKISLVINGDTAFFINGLNTSNQFTVTSGDGEEHNVWFIVPTGLTGGINMSNTTSIVDPIHVFLFTPNNLNMSNYQSLSGQAYADTLNWSNNPNFKYVGVGIPGVALGEETSSEAGFSVEIVSKHEIAN